MDNPSILPRYHTETFGGEEYTLDLEEDLGYRTPFWDEDAPKAEEMFDRILSRHR